MEAVEHNHLIARVDLLLRAEGGTIWGRKCDVLMIGWASCMAKKTDLICLYQFP
jgi:hypothetical protein